MQQLGHEIATKGINEIVKHLLWGLTEKEIDGHTKVVSKRNGLRRAQLSFATLKAGDGGMGKPCSEREMTNRDALRFAQFFYSMHRRYLLP